MGEAGFEPRQLVVEPRLLPRILCSLCGGKGRGNMQRQRLWKGLARAMTGETFPQSFGSKVSAYDSLVLLLENHSVRGGASAGDKAEVGWGQTERPFWPS